MKNRSTWILLGLVLGLGGLYYGLVYEKGGSTLADDETAFAVRDTARIDRITLSYYQNDELRTKLSFRRELDTWTVQPEGGEVFTVVRQPIRGLLAALHNLNVQRPVNEAHKQALLERLKQRQIRVEVDHAADEDRVFFIGAGTQGGSGTEALLKGAENPYIIEVPGRPGTLWARFFPDLNVYRENILFSVNAANLARIEVQHQKGGSFALLRATPTAPWKMENGPPIDPGEAKKWADQFGRVYARAWAQDEFPNGKDSLQAAGKPDHRLLLTDFGGATTRVVFYERADNPNQLFAWTNDGPLKTAQHAVVDRFLIRNTALMYKE